MNIPKTIVTLFVFLVFVGKIVCYCEESYFVFCDNLWDIKSNSAGGIHLYDLRWRHVVIGSSEDRRGTPSQVLDKFFLIELYGVKSLTIINQLISVTPQILFEWDVTIEYLNLYENEIKEIDDYTFEIFAVLKDIYLKKNKLEFLGRAIFRDLSLEVVDLSHNQIRVITSCFEKSNVRFISISHNKLNFIEDYSFPNNLKQLELDYNELSILDPHVFYNLSELVVLSVSHNQLRNFPDISFLKEIHLLNFSFNYFHTINYQFERNPKLKIIDLSFNILKKISPNIFNLAYSIIPPTVKLHFNRLTNLKIDNVSQKTGFSIYGNPWNCDCLFKMEQSMKEQGHWTFCERENKFKDGKLPICIENGPCDKNYNIENYYIDRFLQKFSKFVDDCSNLYPHLNHYTRIYWKYAALILFKRERREKSSSN